MNEIVVKDIIVKIRKDDFISLTDIAKYKNIEEPNDVIRSWLRGKGTLTFLSL